MKGILRSSWRILLLPLSSVSFSCTHHIAESHGIPSTSQPVAQANPQRPETRIPVYYLSHLSRERPKSLNEEEKRAIIEVARKVETKREIWFIANYSGWLYRIDEVYFRPDEVRGRTRVGKALAMRHPTISGTIAARPAPDPASDFFDYVQVGDEPPEKFQPYAQNLPFEMPTGFTLDEVGEIVTRIQSDVPRPDQLSFPQRINHEYPILRFTRTGDDVEVWIGHQEGPLSGGGQIVRFKKEDGQWKIKTIGMWVS